MEKDPIPIYLPFAQTHWAHILIKLFPYQHLCCIVFDCFVLFHKSPIFTVFIHISPCFSGGSVTIRFVSWFVFLIVWLLNQTRRRAKAKERMGAEFWKFGSWPIPKTDHSSERRFRVFPRGDGGGGGNFMFLRGQRDFKIQWALYFLQPDWLIRSFPSNLEMNSHPFFLWLSLGVRDSLVQRSCS